MRLRGSRSIRTSGSTPGFRDGDPALVDAMASAAPDARVDVPCQRRCADRRAGRPRRRVPCRPRDCRATTLSSRTTPRSATWPPRTASRRRRSPGSAPDAEPDARPDRRARRPRASRRRHHDLQRRAGLARGRPDAGGRGRRPGRGPPHPGGADAGRGGCGPRTTVPRCAQPRRPCEVALAVAEPRPPTDRGARCCRPTASRFAYGRSPVLEDVDLRCAPGRVRGARGAERFRQVDAAEGAARLARSSSGASCGSSASRRAAVRDRVAARIRAATARPRLGGPGNRRGDRGGRPPVAPRLVASAQRGATATAARPRARVRRPRRRSPTGR